MGRCYDGKIFTYEEYKKVEQQYIDVVHSVMAAINCTYMTVKYLEFYKTHAKERIRNSLYYDDEKQYLKSFPLLKAKKRINCQKIDDILRMALREYVYFVLSNKARKLRVEFGYDYYMRVSCSLDKEILQKIVDKSGLYLNPR